MATPMYKLTERCFIKVDHSAEVWLHEAGEIIEYSGRPGRTMIPLNKEATSASGFAPLSLLGQNVLPNRGGPPS
jgi:hypothetical protein